MSFELNDTDLLKSRAFIDGQWSDSDSGESFDVTNPATGEVITTVASCGTDETRRAIEAADRALTSWRQTTAKARAGCLRRWFELMMEAQDDLAKILTAEQGKPLAEAAGEIAYGANYVEWFAEEAKRIYGDTIAPPDNGKRLWRIL